MEPIKWWESKSMRSGIISIVCGLILIAGYEVDDKTRTTIESVILVGLPAIGAIVTGIHQAMARVKNRCDKPPIAQKLL